MMNVSSKFCFQFFTTSKCDIHEGIERVNVSNYSNSGIINLLLLIIMIGLFKIGSCNKLKISKIHWYDFF